MTETIIYTHSLLTGDSQVLLGAWYDAPTENLYVRFRSGSQRVFCYVDVDAGTWHDFAESRSRGSFYSAAIRGKFKSYTLDDPGFVYRQPVVVPAPEPEATIVVRVQFDGTLEFRSEGVERAEAVKAVQAWLDEHVKDGTFKVKEIVESFG